MDDEVNKDETIERLIAEVRQLHGVIDMIQREMFEYTDLHQLSLEGSIAYLVSHKKLLDEIKDLVTKANKHPTLASEVLGRVEALLDGAD
jgi:hypothetical protein